MDPASKLWNYYSAFGCVTLLENSKLLVLMTVPLLHRDGTFQVFQVTNLPIPYPRVEQEVGAVARYRIETGYLALNLARTRFMVLFEEGVRHVKKMHWVRVRR